jgi:hypothetical protein
LGQKQRQEIPIQGSSETKRWVFEKQNKTDKASANLTKRREKTQINKIKDE